MNSYLSEGNGPALFTSAVVPLVLTWMFALLRVYVRWSMLKVWKIEDWLFVGSQICFTMLCGCSLMTALHGNSQDTDKIKLSDLPIAMQWWFTSEIFSLVTAVLIRLSIGFFLLRICTQTRYTCVIKGSMVAMAVVSFADFWFTVFQCQPVSYFWVQFSGTPGKCLPAKLVQNISIFYQVFCAVVDLTFGILPVFVVWNLKMNRKAKIIIVGLLGLGCVAGLTIVVRVYYILSVNLTINFLSAVAAISIWSILEPTIGICCMAALTYRLLFTSLAEKISVGSNTKSASHGYNPKEGSGLHSSNFRLSRSMRNMGKKGYLKSVNTDSRLDFQDAIAMENVSSPGTETRAQGPDSKKGSVRNLSEDLKTGISYSKSVEISRTLRKDDMV